jgi:hypothetical protein
VIAAHAHRKVRMFGNPAGLERRFAMTKVNLMDALQRSLQHNPHNLTAALEVLVDANSLHAVLLELAGICAEKSDRVLVNWQDRELSKTWMKATANRRPAAAPAGKAACALKSRTAVVRLPRGCHARPIRS